MFQHEKFFYLFVKKQFDFEDFNVRGYSDYVELMRHKYGSLPGARNTWKTFEQWFSIWGLTEDEWSFCDSMIQEAIQ